MGIVLIAWNAHANAPSQAGRVTRALTDWNGADVQAIVLTEAKGAHVALKSWAREHGFRLYQERPIRDPKDERGDTCVLLRVKGKHAVKPKRQWLAIMDAPWTVFRYRVLHLPRRHRRVAFLLPDGARVRLSGEHWPTRGNRAGWEESYSSARRFLDRRGPALVIGDLNGDKKAIEHLVDDVQGNAKGKAPDWCVTNRRADITVTELIGGGSDHGALLYEVTD